MLFVCLVMGGAAAAQGQRYPLRDQSREVDFANASATRPVKVGTALPSNCSTGQLFFKSDASSGSNLMGCLAGAWTALSLRELPAVLGPAGAILTSDGLGAQWRAVGGDVTGEPENLTVTRLQNRAVANTTPTTGQALVWNGSASRWEPQTISGAGAGNPITVRAAGVDVGNRSIVNFIAGNGVLQTLSDTGLAINIQQDIDPAIVQTQGAAQAGANLYCASSGASATAYTCSLNPVLTAYTTGMLVRWRPDVASAGGSITLNIDGLGTRPVRLSDGTANPPSGVIQAQRLYQLWYDGSVFRLVHRSQPTLEQFLTLARCAGAVGSANAGVSTPDANAVTFGCTVEGLDAWASFGNSGSDAVYVSFWLPSDTQMNAGAALTLHGLLSAGSVRFRARAACRGAAGTSGALTLGTAQLSNVTTSSGVTDATVSVSWPAFAMTGCTPGQQVTIRVERDNSVSGNAASPVHAFGIALTTRKEN
ncbi:MAG: hypothetical protein K2Q23_16525 [Bryobacteraceae bacterium]|nr:hypothetical protein [Bryobacteraceae bacterium]